MRTVKCAENVQIENRIVSFSIVLKMNEDERNERIFHEKYIC